MLLRRFTDFILQGRLQAIGTAFVLAFIPLIGGVSILIAALVTLRKNVYEGALVFLAASIPLVIHYVFLPGEATAGMLLGLVELALLGNLLVWVFAVILRRYGQWNFLLETALLVGVIGVGIVHGLCSDVPGWWQKQLTVYFSKTLDMADVLKTDSGAGLQDVQAQVIQMAKYYATGFLAASILLNALLQLAIARWWQAVIFNPGGLRDELVQIRLSHITGGLFVVVMLLGYFKNTLALDILPVVYAIFAAAGLSLVHCLMGKIAKGSWFWLMLVYLGVIWLFPFSLVALAIMALFDTWLNFRKRASRLKN